jgi:hypothetical protein
VAQVAAANLVVDSSINQSINPHNRTSRDAVRSKDDGLYQATIDRNGLACGDEVVLAAGCPHPVLAGKDDG